MRVEMNLAGLMLRSFCTEASNRDQISFCFLLFPFLPILKGVLFTPILPQTTIMSKLSKREYNNRKYPRPIPISIPLVHISNKYFTPYEVFESVYDTLKHVYTIGFLPQSPIDVVFDIYTDFSFKIFDAKDMSYIWDNGFYGKGILSRSEPTWQDRMQKKIDSSLKSKLDTEEFDEIRANDYLFSEEVTKHRRLLRDAWKREREAYFALEKDIKLRSIDGEISNEDKIILDTERERLSKLKDDLTKGPHGVNPELLASRTNSPLSTSFLNTPNGKCINRSANSTSKASKNSNYSNNDFNEELRMEDYDVIIDSKHIRNLEYLELDVCETLFLLQLKLVRVKINNEYVKFTDLVKLLVETFGPIVINEYVVYYHYRSLGWCVKPGLKFSCDWVLYSRGPPFSHAEFSVKVINENDTDYESYGDTLVDYSAISRVVSGVKKSLVLCFVDGPTIGGEDWYAVWNEYLTDEDFIKLLNNFVVNEITWRRWAPSRTRM